MQPETRALLDSLFASCMEIRDSMKDYVALKLPEAPEEAVGQVRLLIETAGEAGQDAVGEPSALRG